jgi:hypothetical protein
LGEAFLFLDNKEKGIYIGAAIAVAFILAASVILGVTLRSRGARAAIGNLKFADLRNPSVVVNDSTGQNISKTLAGGYVYWLEVQGGGSSGTYGTTSTGYASGWFDARQTGEFSIKYWVGQTGVRALYYTSSTTNKGALGGAGGLGYAAGTKGADSTSLGKWNSTSQRYEWTSSDPGAFGLGGGGGSSAIVLGDMVLIQAKGGRGEGVGTRLGGEGGGETNNDNVETMSGKEKTTNSLNTYTAGFVKITRYDGTISSSVSAGFAPNSVTGNGAGVVVN